MARCLVRDVEWLTTDISVHEWDEGVRKWLRLRRTLRQIRGPEMLARIAVLLGLEPGFLGGTGAGAVGTKSGSPQGGVRAPDGLDLRLGPHVGHDVKREGAEVRDSGTVVPHWP